MSEACVISDEKCIYIRRDYLERLYEYFPEPNAWSERAVFIDLILMASNEDNCCEVFRNYLTTRYGWKQERLYRLLHKMETEGIIHWSRFHVPAPRGCGVKLLIQFIGGDDGDR